MHICGEKDGEELASHTAAADAEVRNNLCLLGMSQELLAAIQMAYDGFPYYRLFADLQVSQFSRVNEVSAFTAPDAN